MNTYVPYEYKGKNLMIERYLVLDEKPCSVEDYDFFNMKMDTSIKKLLDTTLNFSSFPIMADLDRGRNSTLRRFENRKVYLYAPIYSKNETMVIIRLNCCMGKLWVNGKCLAIHSEMGEAISPLTVVFTKGINHLVLELLAVPGIDFFSVYIQNYPFETSSDFRAMSQVLSFQLNPLTLVHEPYYCPVAHTYRFMYMKNDDQLQDKYRADIYDDELGLVKSIPARLNKPVTIDLDELRNLHGEVMCHEWIGCNFKDQAGEKVAASFMIIPRDFHPRTDDICRELAESIREQPADVYTYCKGRLMKRQETNGGDPFVDYNATWHCKTALSWLKSRKFPHETYKTSGNHEWFIHSRLDDSIIRIGIWLPPEYDENKAYPAFIALSTHNDGVYCWGMDKTELYEESLCFDVSGRGCTGGSYIGEASILEILDWIRHNYRIDEDRMYFLGVSNGGYATYALAQNYPSLPAAIFPCIGHPHLDTIENICNIPAYQFVSSKDVIFTGHENDVNNRIKRYGNYHQYDFEELAHHDLMTYFGHNGVLNALLQQKRNLYPQTILFRTYRNRHLESYWIRLHGIAHDKAFANIRADIENPSSIRISVRNAIGLTLTIPPQIDRSHFMIAINGQEFSFENYIGHIISFSHKRNWKISEEIPVIDLQKGTGLADVYLDSLRLILPENASEALAAVADRYAHPYTEGYDPKIYVDYPIYKADNVPDQIFSHNLILFDRLYENPYVERFHNDLPVQYDESGFLYQGIRYEGDYIIRQVIPCPYDNRRSILIYAYNRENLLKKELFSRKVILPFYASGHHPYWNNEILIYFQEKYWVAFEKDSPLKQF